MFTLAAAAGFAWAFGAAVISPLVCFSRGRHQPVKHPLGGFRCTTCEEPLSDLGEAGVMDGGGYVTRGRQ